MMKQCAASHCDGMATKRSAFCLSHAIQYGGEIFLISSLPHDLMPDRYYPAVNAPQRVHSAIMAAVKEGHS